MHPNGFLVWELAWKIIGQQDAYILKNNILKWGSYLSICTSWTQKNFSNGDVIFDLDDDSLFVFNIQYLKEISTIF